MLYVPFLADFFCNKGTINVLQGGLGVSGVWSNTIFLKKNYPSLRRLVFGQTPPLSGHLPKYVFFLNEPSLAAFDF